MDSITTWVLGLATGAAITTGVWAIAWTFLKSERRQLRSKADTTDAIQEIAAVSAQLENQIVAHSLKNASETTFRSAITSGLERITRLLSANLGAMDIYYVKYIESLLDRYRKMLATEEASSDFIQSATLVEPAPVQLDVDFPLPSGTKTAIEEAGEPEEEQETYTQENLHQPHYTKTDIPLGKNRRKSLDDDDTDTLFLISSDAQDPRKNIRNTSQEKIERPFQRAHITDNGLKNTNIIKTENISKEKQSEIENLIIAELSRRPITEGKHAITRDAGVQRAQQQEEDVPEFDVVEPPQQKDVSPIVINNREKRSIPSTKDNNFISGDDLIAKLDSYFGITNE
jgi:hypothetical protein